MAGTQVRDGAAHSALDYGTPGDASASAVPGLVRALTAGAPVLRIPRGRYLIPRGGPDAGGVHVRLTRSLEVRCDPGAVFVTDGVDNDLVRITVPGDGAGIEDGLTLRWFGGTFDMRNMRVSRVVPFIDDYPPHNLGASNTAEGLSIRGGYDGGRRAAFDQVEVAGCTFVAGHHWNARAGGDSGLFAAGARRLEVHDIEARGTRDAAVYLSALEEPAPGQEESARVADVECADCMGGVFVKRGLAGVELARIVTRNCPLGVGLRQAGAERRFEGTTIRDCTIVNAWRGCHLEYVADASVHDVRCEGLGAGDHEGRPFRSGAFRADLAGVVLTGVQHSELTGLRVVGLGAGYGAEQGLGLRVTAYTRGGARVVSAHNTAEIVVGGLARSIAERPGDARRNRYGYRRLDGRVRAPALAEDSEVSRF